ncbi:hypothetical protein RO3G_00114 [Lichtheimia corymbifera JMRC:FSU:9682]|uniref:BHLH domain-containing protein n=1 Tax=Lichtheimia corymbifera JMRC:FSU:9682 TaxID=1263082 RepID=A0A068S0Q4_9FUNG|nr:hypothetical protein RO3G_00114 [Lichtheimia corymbifera JMRC:FSU:9682]
MAYSQHHDPHATPAPVHSTPAPPQPSQDWLYSGHGFQSNYGHSSAAPLQEPVPFEDFQFSFGLDPSFAIPVPLDIPPAPVTEDNSGMLFDDSLFQSMAPPPPPTTSNNGNTSLLNEDDQRIFTSFLDNFCMDQDVEPLPNHMPSLYDLPPSTTTNTSYPPQEHDDVEEEERRRNSILRSLDEQKRMRHRILADAAVAAHHHQSNTPIPSSSSSSSYHHHQHQQHHHHHASTMESSWPSASSTTGGGGGAIFLKKSDSIATPYVIPSKRSDKKKASSPSPSPYDDHQSTRPTPARRNKPHKELLTEAEKRANHIASEQKRRTTIRTGFKDLTEIVPTLKNINNSKSTVLFKAVDYIRYLEKRTKHLHDKVQTLELRMQVEGRSMMVHPTDGGGGGATSTTTAVGGYEDKSALVRQNERGEGGAITNDKGDVGNNHYNSNGGNNNNNNNSTEQALRQHSMQQKHLMQLQEELQKKLLAHHRGFTRPVQEEMDVDEEPLKATVSA